MALYSDILSPPTDLIASLSDPDPGVMAAALILIHEIIKVQHQQW